MDAGDLDEYLTADQLLPLVYERLRALATKRLAQERHGNTLQATALVHEVYLKLKGDENPPWQNRGQFLAAASLAMRRILVDHARRKRASKRGGGSARIPLEEFHRIMDSPDDVLDLDEALTRFAAREPAKADLVQLRFFVGLSTAEAAEALGISLATAERWWTYARTWLYSELQRGIEENAEP